jgi:type IV pilus assembly protein PilA
MIQRLRERAASESGFTLVELLVVMLILGILAAIAIPTFFNQRDKARDADAKTLARTSETAMETYFTEEGNYGTVPATVEARLVEIEPTLQDADLTVSYPAGEHYQVAYDSDTGNQFMIIRHTDGTKSFDCTTEGDAGCPTGGDWGG